MGKTEREVGIRLSVKDKDIVERALKSLGSEGQAAFRRIEASAKPATVQLQALNAATNAVRSTIGGWVAGLGPSLAAVLSFSLALNKAKEAMSEFGDIADNAKAGGLDVEFFQGLTYQAQLAGVEFNEFSSALTVFAKNSGLAAEGKGRMVTQLKLLNPELLRSIQLATTQEQRVRLAAEALSKASNAAEKAALSTAMFGDAGIKLSDAFADGAKGIDEMQRKARELGIVISRDVIAKAEEMGDQFDTVSKVLDLNIKQALINLGPILVWITGIIAQWTGMLNVVLDQFQAVENRQFIRPLQNKLNSELYPRKYQIEQEIRDAEANAGLGGLGGMLDADHLKQLRDELRDVMAEIEPIYRRIQELQGYGRTPPVVPMIPELPNVPGLNGLPKRPLETIDLLAGKIDKVKSDAEVIADDLIRASEQWGQRLGDALGEGFRTGKFEWKDLFNSILTDIAKLATKRLISDPLGNLLSGVAGSLLGGGGNGFAPATGYVPSFGASWETGGWTGGTRGKIAGAVHGEEFVVKAGPAAANRAMLEALNAGQAFGGAAAPAITMNFTYNVESNRLSERQLTGAFEDHTKSVLRQVPEVWRKAYKGGSFG